MSISKTKTPLATRAADAPPRNTPSLYPEPYRGLMTKRIKRALGNQFGLSNFGVNLTTITPGGISALMHRHTRQDEFVYILEGEATLVTDTDEVTLSAGMCAGFPANGVAHQLVNRSNEDVVYLEIGDRLPGDSATYPNDDLLANQGEDGSWVFTHKDGRDYHG